VFWGLSLVQEPEGVVTVASNFEVSYAANRQISFSKVQHDDVPVFGIKQSFKWLSRP
jgi:hypothetical protein